MDSIKATVAASMPLPSSKVGMLSVVYLERLAEPYPPDDVCMAEGNKIFHRWDNHLKTAPLEDPRDPPRPPMILLDEAKLAYDVAEGESVLFTDRATDEIIGLVVQGLVGDEELVANFNGTVFSHLNTTSGMRARANDPGRMTNVGYSAGQRGKKWLGWGKNLYKASGNEEHMEKMSCLFAHIWNLALPYLPKAIVDDYQAASDKLGGITMDAGAWVKGKHPKLPKYKIVKGGHVHEHEATLNTPPQGQCAQNYFKGTHNEVNLNEYAVSYTTCRTMGKEHGGHFYIADYGIRIPGRADQLVSWRAEDLHGTTASDCDPLDEEPKFKQSGISYVLDSGLLQAYENTSKKRKAGAGLVDDLAGMNVDEEETGNGYRSVVLDDSGVLPAKRATMPLIEHADPDWGKYLLPSELRSHTKYKFPVSHAYEKLTSKKLLALVEDRGIPIKKSTNKNERLAALLTSDGVAFEVEVPERVLREPKERKQKKRNRQKKRNQQKKSNWGHRCS